MRRLTPLIAALSLSATLAACGGVEKMGAVSPTLDLTPLINQRPTAAHAPSAAMAPDFRGLPGWGADTHAKVIPALHRTCDWVDTQNTPDTKPIGNLRHGGTMGDWRRVCAAARNLRPGDDEEARRFFEVNFTPVALGGGEDGLFTGYYEPTLRGSWTRTGRFQTPLHAMPPRGSRKLPSRAEIVRGALDGRGLELLYVDDPVDAFFLQIQGSGRVEMTDGSVVQLGYAGQNGHEYFPIGRYFIDQGAADRADMSLQWLRKWLHTHPAEAAGILDMNPSYVFFQRLNKGPRGTRNYILTEGRSLAVDHNNMALGAPVWVDLDGTPLPGGKLRRLMMAQDTGGAIKGTVRGDVFWGHGPLAEEAAGFMKGRGRAWVMAPRPAGQYQVSTLP